MSATGSRTSRTEEVIYVDDQAAAEEIERLRRDKLKPRAKPTAIAGEVRSLTSRISNSQPFDRAAIERQQQEYTRLEAWRASNFPSRHRQALGTVKWAEKPAEKLAEAWAAVASRAMVALLGPRGTGKTQMATEIGYAWVMNGKGRAWYITAGDLFAAMRKDIGANEEDKTLGRMAKFPLLVIDEIQETLDTANEAKWTTRLLDKRYQAMHPTVLIANLKPPEFKAKVGPSVVDRMREGGVALLCDWKSYRSG